MSTLLSRNLTTPSLSHTRARQHTSRLQKTPPAEVPADPVPAPHADLTAAVPSGVAPTLAREADLVVDLVADHLTKYQELFIRGNRFQGRISQQGTHFGLRN